MADEDEFWASATRAWARLTTWSRRTQPGDALEALADISSVRRVLEHAELQAVRAARRANRSWAEIATMLGVTRQSAWERWRELDEPPRDEPPIVTTVESAGDPGGRRSTKVPDVVGLAWADAVEMLEGHQLRAIGSDPDLPTPEDDDSDLVVTDQSPESGARVPRGSTVRLWIERRGGSGVREPRRPKVPPLAGRQWRDEETNSAVG